RDTCAYRQQLRGSVHLVLQAVRHAQPGHLMVRRERFVTLGLDSRVPSAESYAWVFLNSSQRISHLHANFGRQYTKWHPAPVISLINTCLPAPTAWPCIPQTVH